MLISISVIGDLIKGDVPKLTIFEVDPMPIRTVRPYTSSASDPNCLYICAEGIPGPTEQMLNCVIFESPSKHHPKRNYLVLSQDVEPDTAFMLTSNVLTSLINLENELYRLTITNADISDLLYCCKSVFGNQMYLCDISHNVMACGHDARANKSNENFISFDHANVELRRRFYRELKPFFYAHSDHAKILAARIYSNESTLGYLYIFEESIAFTRSHLTIANELVFCIAKILAAEVNSFKILNEHSLIRDMPGYNKSQAYLNNFLARMQWNIDGPFSVMCIVPREHVSLGAYERIILPIKKLFPKSILFRVEENIIVNTNTNTFCNLSERDRKAFVSLMDESGFKCGVSHDFKNVAHSNEYLTQARVAVHYINEDTPHCPVGLYEDCFFEHVLSSFIENFDINKYIHPHAFELAQYDLKYNSHLVHTLLCYLFNDKSYAACTNELQIHKSTLNYRLQKIFDIIGDNCLKPENRLSFLSSLYIALNYIISEKK